MQKQIKEKFPSWCGDTDTKYELMMSDDIDALMCYIFQKKVFNRDIKYFINSSKDRAYQSYDKSTTRNGKQYLYHTFNASHKMTNTIVLDFSINSEVKAWDNHIININNNEEFNELSANMNIALGINSNNYTKKSIVSSFITMLSYYDIPIQNWTHQQKILLCSIDGLYQPFKNPSFVETGEYNLKLLEMEYLVPFIKENLREIEQFYNTYVKGKTIWINQDGYLETNINLSKLSEIMHFKIELPKQQFKLYKDGAMTSRIFNVCRFKSKKEIEEYYQKKIFNIALTYKNSGVVSFVG